MAFRPLTKSEKQKSFLLLGVLFLLANFFGLNWVIHQKQNLEMDLEKLRAQKSYNQAWLSQQALWNQRQDWLTKNQPKLDDPDQGNVHLLESLQKLAKDNNLTIVEQSLLEPHHTANFQEVSVQLHMVGSLESICRWLVAVQQPGQFDAVTNLLIKTDVDATRMRCDLQVSRWYQSGS